ncbi:hypothetical protein AAMO2058_000856700 [Amorphochlora amoebiformis]
MVLLWALWGPLKESSMVYGVVFGSSNEVRRHMFVHQGGVESCPLDDDGSGAKESTGKGVAFHRSLKQYTCSFRPCSKVLFDRTALKRHELIHLNIMPYNCSLCSRSFRQKVSLRVHQQRLHNMSISTTPPECRICKETFTRLPDLKYHLSEVHKTRDPYQCKNCSRTFLYLPDYKNHPCMMCPKCSKVFFNFKELTRHRLYGHPKPRNCSICGRRCSSKSNLDKHLLTHLNISKFNCGNCNRSFLYKCNRDSHFRRKHKQRPVLARRLNRFKKSAIGERHKAALAEAKASHLRVA